MWYTLCMIKLKWTHSNSGWITTFSGHKIVLKNPKSYTIDGIYTFNGKLSSLIEVINSGKYDR